MCALPAHHPLNDKGAHVLPVVSWLYKGLAGQIGVHIFSLENKLTWENANRDYFRKAIFDNLISVTVAPVSRFRLKTLIQYRKLYIFILTSNDLVSCIFMIDTLCFLPACAL